MKNVKNFKRKHKKTNENNKKQMKTTKKQMKTDKIELYDEEKSMEHPPPPLQPKPRRFNRLPDLVVGMNQSTKVNICSAVPLPCFSFFPDFQIVSMAAVPEGRCPVECRGYFVRPSVHPSVCLRRLWLVALGLKLWPGGPGLEDMACKP